MEKCKSSDFTECPSATKSLKCLGSNKDVQHEASGDNQTQRQNVKVSHKMLFLFSLPGTIQRIELPQNMCALSACIKGSLGVRDSQKLPWNFQKSMPGSLGLPIFKDI